MPISTLPPNWRPLVREIDGFVSVERFESLKTPGELPSLSCFRDETAREELRALAALRRPQSKGRAGIFRGYRLRIIRDYGR